MPIEKVSNRRRTFTGYAMITVGIIYLVAGYLLLPQFNNRHIYIDGYVGFTLGMFLLSYILLRFWMSLISLITLVLALGLFRYMQGESLVFEIGTHFIMCAIIAAGVLNITTQQPSQSGTANVVDQ